MAEDESQKLLEKYRQGDEAAAEALFLRYVHRLVALARSRLSPKLARRIDAEDVVQSAYRSFFVDAREGKFALRQSGDLWRLLAVITLNKLRGQAEFHTAGKRQLSVEQSVSKHDVCAAAAEAVTREHSPEQEMVVLEEIELLTEGMDETQRRIVELRLQGFQIDEIAADVRRSERTVRRVMEKVRARLDQRLLESSM